MLLFRYLLLFTFVDINVAIVEFPFIFRGEGVTMGICGVCAHPSVTIGGITAGAPVPGVTIVLVGVVGVCRRLMKPRGALGLKMWWWLVSCELSRDGIKGARSGVGVIIYSGFRAMISGLVAVLLSWRSRWRVSLW